jgi:hypothetical protein
MHRSGETHTLPAFRSLIAIAALSPASAAACPTAADMARGVSILFDDQTVAVYRRDGDTVAETVSAPDGTPIYTYRLLGGLFETGLDDHEAGGLPDSFGYSFALEPLLPPVPGAKVSGTQTASSPVVADETLPDRISVTLSYRMSVGPADTVAIGGCRYEALPVSVRVDYAEGPETQSMIYLRELGFAYVVEVRSAVGVDVFRPLSISAAR